MKTFLQILFFFLLVTQICFAQWYPQNSDTTEILSSIHFEDANNGWIVGGSGIILHTTNGGQEWITQISGTTEGLASVHFTDINNGTAVGGAGTILRTVDGGQNWISQTTGTDNPLHGVFFIDVNNGWSVGGHPPFLTIRDDGRIILRTIDGGQNWISDENYVWGLRFCVSVYFTDANNGTAVGRRGTILRTVDGGQSWISQTSGTDLFLNGVYFTDANNGWIVGDNGTILHTTNGGVTFVEEEQIADLPTAYYLSNNFPNPFNPSTKIKYSVPQTSTVQMKVFDVLGKEIETLVNEEKPVGTYELNWNAANLPSGVYFYRLKAENFVQTRKMILLK